MAGGSAEAWPPAPAGAAANAAAFTGSAAGDASTGAGWEPTSESTGAPVGRRGETSASTAATGWVSGSGCSIGSGAECHMGAASASAPTTAAGSAGGRSAGSATPCSPLVGMGAATSPTGSCAGGCSPGRNGALEEAEGSVIDCQKNRTGSLRRFRQGEASLRQTVAAGRHSSPWQGDQPSRGIRPGRADSGSSGPRSGKRPCRSSSIRQVPISRARRGLWAGAQGMRRPSTWILPASKWL